jgi:hypothetical protein
MLNPDERRRRLRMMIIFLIIVLACVLAFTYDVERPHSTAGQGRVRSPSLGWTVVAANPPLWG